jgi:UPF0755 protein
MTLRRWLILGALLAGTGGAIGYAGLSLLTAPGPLATPADVVVPRGGIETIGAALQDSGVVDSARMFRIFAALTSWQGKLRAAELSFPRQASLLRVLLVLRQGRPVQHKLTLPEGLTAARVAAVLARARGLEGEIEVPAEAGVLPETYLYEWGDRAQSIERRGQQAMQREVARAWNARDPEIGVKSARDLVIVASLVERETHLPAERALVARVFYNRLALGMKLQSDPTVVYAQSGGDGELPEGLGRAALERWTPYNTYAFPGLPAGPICSPGAASIEAAAHPARSAALYFVADGSGGHVFSDSLDEHLRNVRRYRSLGH